MPEPTWFEDVDPLTRWLWLKYVANEARCGDTLSAIFEMGYDVYSMPADCEEEAFAKVCAPPPGRIAGELRFFEPPLTSADNVEFDGFWSIKRLYATDKVR